MHMRTTDDGVARAELNALFDELDRALRCLMAQLERGLDSCLRTEPAPRPDGLETRPTPQDDRRP